MVVFFKFVISWFSGWFMFGTPEPEESISENTAEEALDIATKKADDEEERKKSKKSKHNSGGIVDSNTKEEQDRKKEIKELAIIASEKNRILKEEIKKEEEFLFGSRELHKNLLEKQEELKTKDIDKNNIIKKLSKHKSNKSKDKGLKKW
jgi:hypothetical protein